MAHRVALNMLNARSIDIINTIRANASYEYQSQVPTISSPNDIVKVGDIIFGYPALANTFLSSLMNRIALMRVNGATFNNKWKNLKKGVLDYGETVEEVYVQLAKAREFSVEKAESREFKRTIPDVRSAFHSINWKVQYPITVQYEDLRQAFLNENGVTNLIAKIVDSIYNASEYDEYLLFKYLIIKAVTSGKMYPVPVDMSDIKNAAKAFRGYSNQLTFLADKYNASGVSTITDKNDQNIFMDSFFNARYDVDVLASAFNMDKATFSGNLKLIDSFTEFDNKRFDEIRANTQGIELVTDQELELMKDVKACIIDTEWFQIYDNLNTMTETKVSSGLYWNYFYNQWKIVSSSPFANALVFIDSQTQTSGYTAPDTVTIKAVQKVEDNKNGHCIITVEPYSASAGFDPTECVFEQDGTSVTNGIAVHKYGAAIIPDGQSWTPMFSITGKKYIAGSSISKSSDLGTSITCSFVGAVTALDVKTNGAASVELTPTFASGTTSYTASVANGVTSVVVTPTCSGTIEVYNGTTKITPSEGKYTCTTSVGENTIKIITSDRTYTLVVTRAAS